MFPLMPPCTLRRLTTGEVALAAEMFGPGLDARRVWLFAIPAWNRAFVPGGRLVVWPAAAARADFSDPATPLATQATFVHELTHVWQAQNGVNLLAAKLRAGDAAASYRYDLEAQGFADLNIEQQASVVEHAFLARRGATTQHATARYEAESIHWRG